jgi:predicted transcriptional regulator of viral defense system
MATRTAAPDWSHLFRIAADQEGCFTTRQAQSAGYSPQLLLKHLRAGRITRIQRGIYQLVHFPAGEHLPLAVAWLWSEQKGVFSHQTALALHGLSDALPAELHLTLPVSWQARRLRIPEGVVLHHAGVPTAERTWFGAVPVTTPGRTLTDCARAALSPELLRQAAEQALRRGIVARTDIPEVVRALRPFGGLAS